MYSNSYFCDSLQHVKDNLQKGEVIEYVELPLNKLPEHLYEDDPKRYWEIWKKTRGYKIYSMPSVAEYKPKVLEHEGPMPDGVVRLYRTIPKPPSPPKSKPREKVIVPYEVVPAGG